MNPSTACATVLVDELVRLGCRHAVLCPGSRSAPLAYAFAQADATGRLRLHVRVDERSAGFLALGLGKATRTPVPVVTTSGSAPAHLHPAVLEADAARVPLLVLTADRPPELRGVGANQTTDQVRLYGSAVRWSADLETPAADAGGQGGRSGIEPWRAAAWRTALDRAWAAARGDRGGDAGPVHLNLPFRDPLAPDLDDGASLLPAADGPGAPADGPGAPADEAGGSADATGVPAEAAGASAKAPDPLAGRPDGGPWTRVSGPGGSASAQWWSARGFACGAEPLDDVPRTLVILGDLDAPSASARAIEIARTHGWPVLAEPFGRRPHGVIPHGPLLLDADPGFAAAHAPERILVVGRLTLTRTLAGYLRTPGPRVESVAPQQSWPDPGHLAGRAHLWEAFAGRGRVGVQSVRSARDDAWSRAWREAGERVAAAVAPALAWPEGGSPDGPALASALLAALPAGARLFVGSSNVARDLDVARHVDEAELVANRGVAGIDGALSTAAGMALLGDRPTYALLGDLTFLHDANGLLIGPGEVRPDLTVVVADDGGGGIFARLEYGAAGRERFFERLFTTPTPVDLGALCAAYGVDYRVASTRRELAEAVGRRARGLRVVHVRLDADRQRSALTALAARVTEALGS